MTRRGQAGGATGVPAEAPPLLVCVFDGGARGFVPGRAKKFQKNFKVPQKGDGSAGERIAAAPCGASQ